MLKLVVCQPGEPDREIVVSGDVATIGRLASCDLVLDKPYVSKQHLRILNGLVAVDLGSSNGTFVDGKRLTEAVLIDDRPVAISQNGVVLKVLVEGGEPTRAAPASMEEAEVENLRSRYALLEVEVSKLRRELTSARDTGDVEEELGRLRGENESLRQRLLSLKDELEGREVDDGGSVQARLAMQRVERVQELNETLQREVDRLSVDLAEANARASQTAAESGAGGGDGAELAELRAELGQARQESAELRLEIARQKSASKVQSDQTEVVRRLRAELEGLRAQVASTEPPPDLVEALEASRDEVSELRGQVAELEGRLSEVKPPEGAQVSELFFKLQSENSELRRKIGALESAGGGAPVAPAKNVKELMEARLKIAALESELSNLKVASAPSFTAPPTPGKRSTSPPAAAAAGDGSTESEAMRQVLETFVDKDVEGLVRPTGGPVDVFVVLESVRLLRHVERVVTRVAGDLIQLFQLQTMLPDTVGSYRGIVADLLASDDRGGRQRLVEYLETLGRWLVASIAAHRKAAVLFAEGIKEDLSERGLTAKEPLPAYKRVPVLAGDELWRRTQAYLIALSPDSIDERIDVFARREAKELLGESA